MFFMVCKFYFLQPATKCNKIAAGKNAAAIKGFLKCLYANLITTQQSVATEAQ
jgi:hypothetical protein